MGEESHGREGGSRLGAGVTVSEWVGGGVVPCQIAAFEMPVRHG